MKPHILASLERLKQIESAEMPEPVAIVRRSMTGGNAGLSRHVEITAEFLLNDGELLYGHELLAYAQKKADELDRIRAAEMPVEPKFRQFRGALKPVDRGMWVNGPCDFYHDAEVDAYIDALKAVIQHMSKELSTAVHLNDEQARRVYKAERELAECRKDAERYRWLRELPNADSLNVQYIGADLDNVIDAAIDNAMAEGVSDDSAKT